MRDIDLTNDAEDPPPGTYLATGDLRSLVDLDEVEAWAMVETSPDGMILADQHGTMLLVNAQIEALFGYDRGELLGRPVEELLPDRHRQTHIAHRTQYRAAPKPRAMGSGLDLLGRRKDGTEFSVEVSLAPVTADAKTRVVATVRDISDRVQAEAFNHAVQHSIDAARDGVFMFDPETLLFTYVNQGASAQLGYDRHELLQMTPLHIKPDFTADSFRDLLQPLLDDQISTYTFTTIHRRKDGLDVPVEIIIEYPPAVGANQPRMLVAFVRDITERVAATEAIALSEAAFRTTFEHAPVGIAIVDASDIAHRQITDCNRAFCDLLGYTRDEILTMGFGDLTYADDAPESDASAQQAASGSVTEYALEKRYIHADGHPIWVWVHSAVLPAASGAAVRGIVHVSDLTERKRAEADREATRRWLAGLAEVRTAALAGGSIQRTLDLVCFHARDLIDADRALIVEPTAARDQVIAVAYDSQETQELLPSQFEVGPLLQGALDGHSGLSERVATDPQVAGTTRSALPPEAHIGSALVVPIQSGQDVDAVLVVAHQHEGGLSETHLATIESFAAEAATTLQLHLARSAASKLEILEDRERLARDLHDLVIQRLFAAGMTLQSAVGHATNPIVAERMTETVSQLDQTIADLRSAIFELNTPTPTSAAATLNQIVEKAAPALGFEPDIEVDGELVLIPGLVLEQLGPALTEALSNVAQHASATSVRVSLRVSDSAVELTVVDDGVGLDADAAHGHGLRNLRSRAQRVGGTASLVNNDDTGTTLIWTAAI